MSALPPDPAQGLFDLGFDSLMALELRNRLETAVGRPLAATLAFDHPSIAGIALHLLDLLGLANGEPAARRPAPAQAAIDDALAALEIRQLSEAELEALVDRELQRSLP
jgi:epothilone polyketide synthase D